ncbi:hypothetical protein [Saccharopolyspora shandongensis]|uniref:hypothetical protein n=1 Tax=Saccharopolyspora shandongensis TaxID=418495 RepID=UPI0033E9E098
MRTNQQHGEGLGQAVGANSSASSAAPSAGARTSSRSTAVEVEAEVEERATLLLSGGQRSDLARALGGHQQAHAVVDLLAAGLGQQLLPLPRPLGDAFV